MSDLPPSEWTLPKGIQTRLRGKPTRQRCFAEEGVVLIHLHEPPRADAELRESAYFFFDPSAQTWSNSLNGSGLSELDALIDRYEALLDELERNLNSEFSARNCFQVLRAINPIGRALKNLISTLQVARDALPGDHALAEQIEEAHAQDRVADLLQADARNALDFALAEETERHTQVNLELTKAAHRLNLMVALFLPLTALASLFGMNLVSGLEEFHPPWLFWAVLFVGVSMGFIVRQFINSARVPIVEKLSPRKILPRLNLSAIPLPTRGGRSSSSHQREPGIQSAQSESPDLDEAPDQPARHKSERRRRQL